MAVAEGLQCIFGRHRWTIREEDGEVSNVCSRCGKVVLLYRPDGKNFADRRYKGKFHSGGGGPPGSA